MFASTRASFFAFVAVRAAAAVASHWGDMQARPSCCHIDHRPEKRQARGSGCFRFGARLPTRVAFWRRA
eukprot:13631293-Alexandrium_andersonii.AAC.1